ncbi:hypothetical protein LdCL_220006600 [Leishmania donovani]|uniref:EF-hand domain-containing protein n=1 Tax=Leishmania donovani TaxID=5661 RepID=A0A3S7WWW1_LEIDO|nr:hypothetical protein LdCL_220006600 [Leishmania donovani]
MTDSSYSYTGSYTGDYSYSYSYSYSDGTGSYTDSTAEKSQGRVPRAAPAAKNAQSKKTPSPSKPEPTKNAESGESYGYSYSAPSSPNEGTAGAAVPAAADSASSQKRPTNANEDDDRSYSYSYTNDDEDSYSYSYSDSETGTASPPALRAPKAGVAGAGRQHTTPAAGRADRSTGATPPAVTSTAAAATNVASTGSYSYSDSDDEDGSYTYSYSYSYSDEGDDYTDGAYDYTDGSYYYSDGSYYYSDGSYYYTDGSYDYSDGSYYYSGGSSYYSDGSYYYSDGSYYYSDTYSYTGDSSYYYSYSSSVASGEQRGRRAKPGAEMASGSSDYYYSYSGDYADLSDSYYYGSSYASEDSYYDYLYPSYSYSSYTDSEGIHHHAVDRAKRREAEGGSGTSSYTYSATGKSPTSTSSYTYGSFAAFLLSESRTAAQRELLVLRAPVKDLPHPPQAPNRCFVVFKTTEDAVWAFLQRLMAVQKLYEARRVATGGQVVAPVSFMKCAKSPSLCAAGVFGIEAAEQEDTVAPFIPTKDGCFSERSMRIAFRVLRLNHLERREALKNAPLPLPMEVMLDIFNTCVAARAKERVVQAFLAHDTYRSGEMSLTQLCALLRRLGLGTSPIIEGHRISIGVSTEGALEMVVNVEQVFQAGAPVAPASAESQKPVNWEVTPVYVLRIIRQSAARKESAPVRWKSNTLYMGRHVIVRNVATKALFQRLKTYIEAATYLCVLAKVFSIKDAEKGTLTVQYPQFIRSVLLAEPSAHCHAGTAAWAAPRKLLYIENLFRAVFRPHGVLRAYAAGRPVPRYHRDWAVESTLYSTKDTEEKRRRNVVPGISSDMRLMPVPSSRPAGEVQLSFVLQKVRVPAQPPRYARCFCLVSAVTPANVFLPAVEVPVRLIVASARKCGYYTWMFHDKKHKKREAVLQFAGPAVDRIYVECCYETHDIWPPESSEDAAAQAEEAAGSTAPSCTTTVWCAGYAVFPVNGARTAVLPVKAGSLLQEQPYYSTLLGSGVAAGTAASAMMMAPGGNYAKLQNDSYCCASKSSWCGQHKYTADKAHQIQVKVLKSEKPIPGAERLPARYIAFQRHVPMISQLRSAVELVGRETSHVGQAFRQQAVRYIFSVAADPALLDQLCGIWKYRERHWSKAERKNEGHKQRTLLSCVAALYALKNSCAGSKEIFAKSLEKGKLLHMTIDPAAPMVPVRV